MHTIAEALDAMLPAFGTLGTEEVLVTEAHGRYLAEDVAAAVDSPPFDNSAMDGYAVFAGDVAEGETSVIPSAIATSAAGIVAPLHAGPTTPETMPRTPPDGTNASSTISSKPTATSTMPQYSCASPLKPISPLRVRRRRPWASRPPSGQAG